MSEPRLQLKTEPEAIADSINHCYRTIFIPEGIEKVEYELIDLSDVLDLVFVMTDGQRLPAALYDQEHFVVAIIVHKGRQITIHFVKDNLVRPEPKLALT